MEDNKDRIKKMFDDGKITQTQADILLDSLGEPQKRKDRLCRRIVESSEGSNNGVVGFITGGFVLVPLVVMFVLLANNSDGGARMSYTWIFFLFIFLILTVCAMGMIFLVLYNVMVRRQELVKESWAQIGNLCRRKLELIPLLLDAVQKYSLHEKSVIDAVASARSDAKDILMSFGDRPALPKDCGQILEQFFNSLKNGLNRIKVVIENYPNLKADTQYILLEEQIRKTEDGITQARAKYNQRVNIYNTILQTFPFSIIATMFNFQPKEYFGKAGVEE